MLADLRIRIRALLRRDRVEAELHDELNAHLDAQIQQHIDAGCSRAEAHRRAVLELGGVEQVKEACRDARGVTTLETTLRDLQYAARTLRRDRAFAAVIVLTLALGIGATSTVFGVVNAVLLKPLPYPSVDRIVLPWRIAPPSANLGFDEIPWGRRDFLAFAGQTTTFEHIAAFLPAALNLTGSTAAVRLNAVRVSAGFFPVLGIEPQLGRTFTADEDRAGAAGVAVLSDRTWRERFNADPAVVGRSITLNGSLHTVVGIMPPGFAFPLAAGMPSGFPFAAETDLWVPLALSTAPPARGEPSELAVMGRLREGTSYESAQAELDLFARQMERLIPRAAGWFNSRVTPMAVQTTGQVQRPLWLLFGAVAVLLLIACSNIAGLLLSRSAARAREFALRAALGAGRGRLISQLITESLLIAAAGGIVGVVLAHAGVAAAKTFGTAGIPRLGDARVDTGVLAFTALLTMLTGLLFGIMPAIVAGRAELADVFKSGTSRSTGDRGAARLRGVLLVTQIALALVLVVASTLLARTFAHLVNEDAGFNADRVLTGELTLPLDRYSTLDAIVAFYGRALDAIEAVPGVERAGLGETIPLDGNGESTGLRIPDLARSGDEPPPFANYTIASPGYLEALGVSIVAGRNFQTSDRAESLPVVIVNEAFARKYWPGQTAIGKRVGVPIEPHDMTVVGVAANVKHLSLREEVSPEIYVPFTQKPWPSMQTMHFAVKTSSAPGAMAASIREALRTLDADVPLARVVPMSDIVDRALAQPRLAMLLVGAFGALSLLLAAVGLYGSVAYTVAARTAEIGIRVALGAQRRSILGMAIAHGLRLALLGIAAGAVLVVGGLGLISHFLYGIEPTDPVTLAGVAMVLLAVSLSACYLPARRAARIDPLLAIRTE